MADPTLITPNSRNSDRVSFLLDTDWKDVFGDSYEETFLKYETTFDFTSYNNTWNSREVEPTNSTGDCQKSLLGTINFSIDNFFTFLVRTAFNNSSESGPTISNLRREDKSIITTLFLQAVYSSIAP